MNLGFEILMCFTCVELIVEQRWAKLGAARENKLTFGKQNLAFSHLQCVRLKPTAMKDLLYRTQYPCQLGLGQRGLLFIACLTKIKFHLILPLLKANFHFTVHVKLDVLHAGPSCSKRC